MLCNLKIIFPGCFCFFFLTSCLVFSELPRWMVWFLTLIWGNSQSLWFQIFFLFLSLFILLLIFPLHICDTFCSSSTVLGYSVFFFSLCSLCFSMLKVLLIYPQTQKFLSSTVSGLLTSPSKAFFISVTVFLISSISFWFFLRIFIYLLILPMCCCILSNLFIIHVNHNCLTLILNLIIPAFLLYLVLVLALSLQIVLVFSCILSFFLESET